MNIGTETVSNLKQTEQIHKTSVQPNADKNFKSKMEELKTEKIAEKGQTQHNVSEEEGITKNSFAEDADTTDDNTKTIAETDTKNLVSAIEEINNSLNQTDDFTSDSLNTGEQQTDIYKNKEFNNQLLNNDMNMQSIKNDKMSELKTDINFAQNSSESFSSFFNNNFQESTDEMQEDSAILSTMAENIAMVNRVLAEKTSSVKAADKTASVGEVIDKTINASALNMTRNDVQFFINLTSGNTQDFNEIFQTQETAKSSAISETLANLIADSMKTGKPFRINFDNDISVIIKLSREGKISANFIPGSDAAENYLRNNLSGLVQRFEDENLPYDDLSRQRQKRDSEQEQNKKGSQNE